LAFLVNQHAPGQAVQPPVPGKCFNLREPLEDYPDIFRPDGNLNPREIPIALQLPDWSGWLPRVHPKDAWGPDFAQSEFAALSMGSGIRKQKQTRRQAASAHPSGGRRGFRNNVARPCRLCRLVSISAYLLKRFVKAKMEWSPALTDKVYSTQLWQLVKTWEMMQELGWKDAAATFRVARGFPHVVQHDSGRDRSIVSSHPDGAAGVGGSALTNEYFMAAWYELQIILNSGNHQHRDRGRWIGSM